MNIEKEKQRCMQEYPDWKDDEFNCLDNKFIWGVKAKTDQSGKEPSFTTLNDIQIYYNRKSKLFFLDLDISENYIKNYTLLLSYLDDLSHQPFVTNHIIKCPLTEDEKKDLFSAKSLGLLCNKFLFFTNNEELIWDKFYGKK